MEAWENTKLKAVSGSLLVKTLKKKCGMAYKCLICLGIQLVATSLKGLIKVIPIRLHYVKDENVIP